MKKIEEKKKWKKNLPSTEWVPPTCDALGIAHLYIRHCNSFSLIAEFLIHFNILYIQNNLFWQTVLEKRETIFTWKASCEKLEGTQLLTAGEVHLSFQSLRPHVGRLVSMDSCFCICLSRVSTAFLFYLMKTNWSIELIEKITWYPEQVFLHLHSTFW